MRSLCNNFLSIFKTTWLNFVNALPEVSHVYFLPHVFHTSYFTYLYFPTLFRNVSYFPIFDIRTSQLPNHVLLTTPIPYFLFFSCGAYVIIFFLDSKPLDWIWLRYFLKFNMCTFLHMYFILLILLICTSRRCYAMFHTSQCSISVLHN